MNYEGAGIVGVVFFSLIGIMIWTLIVPSLNQIGIEKAAAIVGLWGTAFFVVHRDHRQSVRNKLR